MITITVTGKPIAQARPRFVRRGKFVSTYNPQETEAGRFMLLAKSQLPVNFKPLEGPLRALCEFRVPIPSSKSKKAKAAMLAREVWPTGRPDLDNYVKFVKDALNGLVWGDDSQIVDLFATKVYAEQPGTVISVAHKERHSD